MLKLSANISTMFTEHAPLDRLAAAAAAGFSAVEMQFPYELDLAALVAAQRAARVEFVVINIPAGDFAGGERGIACLPGRHGEFLQAVARAVEYAAALGCRRLNCLAGNRPEGENPSRCWDMLADNVAAAADVLAPHGMQLLLEPLNRRDNRHFLLGTMDEVLRLRAAAGRTNIALQHDIYHAYASGEGELPELARRIGQIGHIQFSDYPGRGQPGTGEIDWPAFFNWVQELPYTSRRIF
jgi:hydroxypyruvate isomerase